MANTFLVTGATGGLGRDYNDPNSLEKAFSGVERLFFVSSSTFNNEQRIRQHANVIAAAKKVGVGQVYYSSLAFGGYESNSKVDVRQAHLKTEQLLQESGISYTSVREGIYADCFPVLMNWYPSSTEVLLPADGPIAFASRAELAEATAQLRLKEPPTEDRVLLTGPRTHSLADLVKIMQRVTGKELRTEDVS
ncbi:MAG: hypothetical protein M1833_001806 [Piccolia ochrophora]|nr:MAG: hypothetical protein M1833_001806 [Piccolia ochrophora]